MPNDGGSLSATLHARGQRVTPQRLVIHRALSALGRHATAEEVSERVRETLPNVSLPTIYATLELLRELGIVRRLPSDAGAALYDPRPEPHHHLVCERCGRVEDLDATVDVGPALRSARRRDFLPDHAEVVVTGRCRDCA